MADDQNQPQSPQIAAPAGGGGAPTGKPTADLPPELMQQMGQLLKSQMRPHTQLQQRQVNPAAKQPGMGAEIGMNLLSMLVPFVGAGVQKAVHSAKEMEVNAAINDYAVLNEELEMADTMTGGDQQKMMEAWGQSPRVQAILNDKKKRKQIAKAFSIDWMNPEKTQQTVHYQGLQRFMQLNPAAKLVKSLKGMMGHGGQEQPMMPNQQVLQNLPKQQVQPDPKTVESTTNMLARRYEFEQQQQRMEQQHKDQLQEMHQYHIDTLQQRRDALEERIKADQERLELSRENAKSLQEYRAQMIQLRREMQQQNLELRREQMQMKLDAKGEKSKIPIQIQNRVLQADLIDEQIQSLIKQVETDGDLRAIMGPVSGTAAKLAQAKRWSKTVQNFATTVESMDALFAILHGYRGGAHVHEIFKAATGDLSYTPEAFIAGLKAYQKLNDTLKEGVAKRYPGDPFVTSMQDDAEPKQDKPKGKVYGKDEIPE